MNLTSKNNTETSNGAWFDNLIAKIRTDQLQLESGVASPELSEFYQNLQSNNQHQMAKMSRELLLMALVPSAIDDFLKSLKNRFPNKLAFSFTDSSLLAWAEIREGNEEMEDLLIDAEAKVNAKYNEYGFHMDSMVVEDTDHFEIPPHYKTLIG